LFISSYFVVVVKAKRRTPNIDDGETVTKKDITSLAPKSTRPERERKICLPWSIGFMARS